MGFVLVFYKNSALAITGVDDHLFCWESLSFRVGSCNGGVRTIRCWIRYRDFPSREG